MKAIITLALLGVLVAGSAAAVEVALGLFGGEAYPQGETTAYTPLTAFASELPAGGLGKGSVVGGKAVAYFTPELGVEVAVVKYPYLPAKEVMLSDLREKPSATVSPITVGPVYKWNWHGCGVYAVAGLGYFPVRYTLTAGSWQDFDYVYKGVLKINSAGAFGGVGVCYRLGPFEAEVSPRYAVAWNKGMYNYDYERKVYGYNHPVITTYGSKSVIKAFNDSFVDVRAGVNFYLP